MCEHKRYMCRNNVFICLLCGAEIPNPYRQPANAETREAKKQPAKRRAKKEAAQDGKDS